jgi:hypothetical protein
MLGEVRDVVVGGGEHSLAVILLLGRLQARHLNALILRIPPLRQADNVDGRFVLLTSTSHRMHTPSVHTQNFSIHT